MSEFGFSPCFLTEEEFENAYKNSVFYVEGDYATEYRKHLAALDHIANLAKVYILKNWKSVTDWSDLDIEITHVPTGKVTEYYNHDRALQRIEERKAEAAKRREARIAEGKKTPREVGTSIDDFFLKYEEENRARHNPILEFTDVVLDPSDGDFSVTINGNEEHWWINNEEVIAIAEYIETKLKNEGSN
jgi:hypothetical protein